LIAAAGGGRDLDGPDGPGRQFMNVLTGRTSGVYYSLGIATGKIYSDKIPTVKARCWPTKASVDNLI
jgi:TRAP-type uncharacterized transport system substrate-binding protein